MARNSGATRFASVNLNQSYGKQPQTASPAVGGSGTRSRLPGTTHGGMLLLTRPTRPQPAGLKNPKLTVPRPVNLPSLRREHAGNDPTVSLVGGSGTSGWIKQQQISEDLLVDSVSASHGVFVDSSVAGKGAGSSWGLSQQSATLDGELRPRPQQTAGGRSGVYTPPGARVPQADVFPHPPIVVPSVVAVEKAVLLRGEDFPTLQASLAPVPASAPAPPPHDRQKELQQRQRDKQRELKEQQKKLHQLTQKHQDEEAEKIQQLMTPPQPVVSLQPQSKHDQVKKVHEGKSSEAMGHGGKHPIREEGRSLPSGPASLIRLNRTSNWADDERDNSINFKSKEDTIKPQEAAFLDWIDRESEPLVSRRPFQRETPPTFGRNADIRRSPISYVADNLSWDRVHVKEGISRDNRRKDYMKDNALGVEGSFGRDLAYGRERTFGRDNRYSRISDFGIDRGSSTRDDAFDKAHTISSNVEASRGRSGLDRVLPTREMGGNREMSFNQEDSSGENGPQRKGMGNHDRGSYGVMNGYTKSGSIDRENYRGGLGIKDRDSRESFGGMNGQNKDPRSDPRGEREGLFRRDGLNAGRSAYDREARDGSFGRDGFFSKSTENGNFDGEKTFNRFRNGRGRETFQEFGMSKAGRSDFASDNGRGRTGNSMLHSTDPYTRAFAEFVRVDYRSTSVLGFEMFESKALRRKKDVKESNFRDLERESFEAELERVQKLLEDDRQRKIEEQERAIEMARKEQEERERLAKEEEERQLRLEEEAREAAAKAEREALEAVHKAEEIRRAREEEKKQILLEEEARKENARRKLLELEERIAKREADKKRKEEEEMGQLHRGGGYNAANNLREDTMGNLEDDARERIFSMDREDDDRAPLRPSSSERPLPKFKLLHSGPSFIKSPEELNQQVGGYDVSHESGDMGSGSLGLDAARASSFWKKGPFENDVDSALMSKRLPYPPADVNNPHFALSRDRSYHVRRFDDWEQSPFGSSYSYSANSPGDRVSTEKLARKDQLEGSYNWRQGVNDGVEPQMKYENGHLRYSDVEQGSAENSFSNRGSDRRGYNDKLYRSWEGRPSSPLSPPPYYHGADSVEGSASGRLRQFLPKQPRVPPPPLQTYKKPLSKSVGDHLADDSNLVHHETKVYIEQEMRSKEHIDLKNTRVVDLDFQSLPTKLQEAKQSSSSESELNLPPSENSQQFLAHQSELSSSPVAHPGTLSLEIEPVSKPLVESHNVRLEEEDSGEEGDEEMLEDSEAAEYAEEEVSYEERGDFEEEEEEEEEEENHGDVEEEKVVSYKEDICDEVEESFDAELSTEKVHSKTDKVCTGISELTVDSFEVIEGDNNTVLELDEEPLKLSAVKEQIQYASASDLQSHNLMAQEMPLDCTAAIDQQVEESSEILVQPKHLQERMTSSSSAFQSVGTINSHTSSSAFQSVGPIYSRESAIFGNGISYVQQQHLDNPMMMPSATPLPVTSSYTPLSVVQNHLEVPMTLQFGLLPSTSLLPASVPAIQIGSIQMPLPVHMHSHLSPHVTHLHPSHASPFQFGQLGHPIALSQLLPSFSSQAQPVGRASMQNENMEQQSVTIPPVSSVHQTSAAFDEPVYLSSEVVVPEPVRFIQAASLETLNRVEDENFEKEASEPAPQNASNMEEQNLVLSGNKQENNTSDNDFTKNISQYVALFDANAESTAEVHQIPRRNFEHRKNEGGSWQQSHLQSSTSNLPLRSELGVREGEKAKDWHFSSEFSGDHEMRHEGTTYHGRSNRRNNSRGSEFRVKEALMVNDGSAGGPRQSSKARCLNSNSTSYSRNRGTHDKVFQKDGFKGQVTYERKSDKESGHTPASVGIDYFWNSGGKTEKSNEESVQKNLARGRSGDGLLGKFGSMEDVPLQSGIVHVFEQPGIEVPGDEDDFIEVRSKRQMLNDRREQREKEIKAKSKAKEQVGRKLKFSAKQATQGDSVGPKHPGSAVSERKNLQGAKADAAGSSGARLVHSGTPTETLLVATSVATSSSLSSLPAITSNISETVLDKKSKLTNSTKTTLGAGLPISDGDVSSSPILDTLAQDNVTTSTHAWGVTRSSQQVVSLTQIQLEEVLKPVRYDLPLQPQLSLGEHGIIGIEAGSSNNSLVAKERISASMTDSTIPPLNGEEIQFGAVTSTYVSPISRPNTPSILGAVGSSVAFRSDTFTDSNELRKKLKQLPGTEDDVSAFGTKGDWSREDGRRNGGTFDSEAEAEAEAAASAVAVAAISNDDSVKGLKYGSSQSNSVSGILNSASLNHANLGGHVSSSSSSGVMLGASSTRPVIVPAPVLEDIKAMALPADLSVETHSFSLGGNSHSGQGSSGLLLPSLPSAFPGLDLGPMIGGHMFAFGAGSDVPNGLQGMASGAVHEQGAANLGLNIAGWQQHVGSSDSFYGAPHGFSGPFMSPAGAVPTNLQAPHHMLVYTNPFAPIGQFGQLGVSFMGATYIQSGKQPDWTHTPVTSSCPGLVSMSVGEGLGGVLASQRNISGVASPIQRLAPGPSVVPVTPPSGPFDLSREATFQIPTVEVPMQPPWSHVSVPHLQSMPTTGPLLGYSMQSRHPHGSFIPTGHLQHAADANMHIVHSPNTVSGSSFQSVDASVQFPDELGLGDSISTTSNPVNSYVGQQLSSKGAVGSAVSTGTSAAAEVNKLQRGRRPRMARGGGMQGTGEGMIGSHPGFGTSPGNAIGQPANIGRSSPGHLHPEEQVPLLSPGQHMHHVGFVNQKATSQLLRAGATGSWSGQGSRKVGMPARPQATDRGISSEKSFVSSTKLKQVYVVKPSAAYKRMGPNSGESAANMFVHDVGQTGIDG